jgi:hypothetical protein
MIKLIKGDGLGGEGLHFIPKIHKNTSKLLSIKKTLQKIFFKYQ